uniref:NADH-ubiquinone oxidoreductase chain 6 n=1 Tax=Tineola bisselliella TaxID=93883 RepID=A0A076E9Z4_TINBI|nr:NADH dehydrogenase subunit 6 [Tineola bisselliella]
MKITLNLTLIMLSFFMFFIIHPLSMMILILIQTLLTCLITGLLINSYWFSYILFLTFLGGILILFIYITSIASNEMFKFSLMMFYYLFSMFLIIMMIFLIFFKKNLIWLNFSMNYEMNKLFNKYLFFNNENKLNLTKLYNEQTFIFMMMLIIYLLITLIMTVKITNVFYGPLRTFN